MPTEFEAFPENSEKCLRLPPLKPGDRPASFFSADSDRSAVYYKITCAPDDSQTSITRIKSEEVDEAENSSLRIFYAPEGEIVKMLTKGESYELSIVTKKGVKIKLRITHQKTS